MYSASSYRAGFSLVELSIVLVILGLLVGGVLGGQALIRASELRSVIQELEQHRTRVNAFRVKYFGLPGDITNATDFWGEAGVNGMSGQCPGNNTTPSTDTGTCNGDGNGLLEDRERFRFWQQLANAGLIEGAFTGVTGTGSGSHMVIGENVPVAKLGGAGWAVSNYDNSGGGSSGNWALDFGNHFAFGAQTGTLSTLNPAITPEEAWNIDTKADDGIAGRGVIKSQGPVSCGGGADNTDIDATYALMDDSIQCAFRISDPNLAR